MNNTTVWSDPQAGSHIEFASLDHLSGGLGEFADTVVPLLRERGVFRSGYTGPTLRDHLGIR